MADTELGKVFEQAEYPHEPQDQGNHNNGVQNTFDLALHRDEAIHEPHQQANYSNGDNNGDEGHRYSPFQSDKADKFSRGLSIGTASFGAVRCYLNPL
jgi:hypothetical protein